MLLSVLKIELSEKINNLTEIEGLNEKQREEVLELIRKELGRS